MYARGSEQGGIAMCSRASELESPKADGDALEFARTYDLVQSLNFYS
ncbi:hypothetical protein NJ7G_0248 [Natrinema sp. J7-2]|nr:hypothetical protein NJ7G_0248 [Natrinema sp. J7-2]